MKFLHKLCAVGYVVVTIMFFICGIALIVMAGTEMWEAISPYKDQSIQERFQVLLECIGRLTIAVAAFELGQTILEEEVQRDAHVAAPTRVRRFLSRFLIVVVVSLSVECLIGVFQFMHSDPELLPQVAAIGVAAAILLIAWGWFVRMNVSAEMLEPEAMEEAQEEDKEVET